jgi:TM2 domain-containing membrane protein YozV
VNDFLDLKFDSGCVDVLVLLFGLVWFGAHQPGTKLTTYHVVVHGSVVRWRSTTAVCCILHNGRDNEFHLFRYVDIGPSQQGRSLGRIAALLVCWRNFDVFVGFMRVGVPSTLSDWLRMLWKVAKLMLFYVMCVLLGGGTLGVFWGGVFVALLPGEALIT